MNTIFFVPIDSSSNSLLENKYQTC